MKLEFDEFTANVRALARPVTWQIDLVVRLGDRTTVEVPHQEVGLGTAIR